MTRRRILSAALILVAILLPIVGASRYSVSSGFEETGEPPSIVRIEFGAPPIARIDYIDESPGHHLPREAGLRYGYFLIFGFVAVLCFSAGRLSHAAPVRKPNVA